MKIKKYILMACVPFLFVGCSLDFDESNGDTKEIAYSYYDNLAKLVAYVYSFLPTDLDRSDGAMMESATDNAIYSWENNDIYNICNGVWSPIKTIDTGWNYFNAIRSANSFLENFDIEVLKEFKFNDDYDAIMAKAKLFPYEVRFLRAFYFFELAKRYGNIPMLTKTYEPEEINTVVPSSFDEIVNFIVTECDQIAYELPVDHTDYQGETGRATRGAVLALKSRALLYAASPLHNASDEKSKWEAAARAAAEIIGLDKYSLPKIADDPLYSSNGANDVLNSPQLIFERRDGNQTSTFEARNEPMGYEGSQGGNTPTQNFVDAFEMKTGETFDWNNAQHVQNMYVNAAGEQTRDPRLYLNVLHNGATWLKQKVETTVGGANVGMDGATKTGYYLRKHMNGLVSLDPVKPLGKEHHFPLFRYAEILLNYAEAMYKWVGPDAIPDKKLPLTARQALNLVRDCAGMKHVTATGEEFLKKVRNERRIELAFEDHRFWDIRRWKIGEVVKDIYGVKITGTGANVTYQRVLVEQHQWDDKMYLFPIPQKEIYMNSNLKQNPGWN